MRSVPPHRLKQEHASTIIDKRTSAEGAKRALRDVIFSARFVSPEKTRMMKDVSTTSPKKLEATAAALGLLPGGPPARPDSLPGSPYKLTSPPKSPPKKKLTEKKEAVPTASV